ncbi:S41 family peptidase [Desertivirga xinjiangensis]|uniref:S41 family peptidase n=1 Tax=Desertivirga xinjiangensis TaxID=539206 RepID=UPI0021090D91|nr:S41 family peptidase [Pedobacter xinjiangensis]
MKSESSFSKVIHLLVLTGFLCTLSVSCKKDNDKDTNTDGVETPVDIAPTTGSRNDMIKDSVFLYARQIYLWWREIPDYNSFKPRRFTGSSPIDALDEELYAITRYGINPANNKPYEFRPASNGSDTGIPKYSYFTDADDQNPSAPLSLAKKSAVDLEGNGLDFGIRADAYGEATNYKLYIEAVYPGSDAAKKGLKRGDYISKINGTEIGTNYNSQYNLIWSSLESSSSVSLTVQKGDGSGEVNLPPINRTSYASSPVLKEAILNGVGSQRIGYMAYARFSNLTNSLPEFTRVFNTFASQGVTDLIIDLRYNGGGYVSTAEYLINFIAPSSLNGKVMYAEHFNELMQAGKATILSRKLILDAFGKSQDSNNDGKLDTYADVSYDIASNTRHFSKKGSLNNISRVVFIVSGSTASASELVINSLEPYLDVKIVGETTYGKPVGFFPIRFDNYDMYLSMFESRNARNEGGYFLGITPDTGNSTADNDNPAYDFGDIREASLKAAYSYLTQGSLLASTKSSTNVSSNGVKALELPGKLNKADKEFKGMIEDRIIVRR